MAPVTRFAAFKYKPGVTDEQKRKVFEDLVQLYQEINHLVNYGPRGGRNNSMEGYDKGFDVAFTVQFKSIEDRDQFIPHEKHVAYKMTVLGLIEDAIVYDFIEGDFGY